MKRKLTSLLAVLVPILFAGTCLAETASRVIVLFRRSSPAKTGQSLAHRFSDLHQTTQRHLERLPLSRFRKADVNILWGAEAAALSLTDRERRRIAREPQVESIVPVVYRHWLGEPVAPAQVASDSSWGIDRIGAPKVWQECGIDGSGILVGHLDSGVFAGHPALTGQVCGFRDFTATAGADLACYDDQGHGTHTAGTIAGKGAHIGVAPGAKLLVGRILDTNGGGTNEAIMTAMQWMLDPDGNPATMDFPRVINNSWGSSSTTDKTFWRMIETWTEAGIIPVFAAGNNGYDGGKVGVPAAFPHAFAVGATDSGDDLAWFSSTGPAKWDGQTLIKPDVAAPGSGIISAGFQGGFVKLSGTSMAAPHAAGVIALVLQANPTLSGADIIRLCRESAVDVGNQGPDNKFGAGIIDAAAVVKKVLQATPALQRVQALSDILAREAHRPGAANPLAAAYARHLVATAADLSPAQFKAVSTWLCRRPEGCYRALLRDMMRVRRFPALHRDSPN